MTATTTEVHTPQCWTDRATAGCTCPPMPETARDLLGTIIAAEALVARSRAIRAADDQRNVVDVTDLLTPGARAAAMERARIAGMLATTHDRADAAHARGFADGRAYERGAQVSRLIGKTATARTARVLEVAREYLDDGDPRGAALVLAGYSGAQVRP